MRILFLLTQDLQSPSGVGRYLPLAKNLSALGHQVLVCALHSNYPELERKEFLEDGVKVVYVAQMHVQKTLTEKVYFSPLELINISSRATWALANTAIQNPVDIIHVFKPHPMNSIAGLLGRLRYKVPLFLDCDDLESESHFTGSWQKAGVSYFENHMPLWVDHITTHNSYLENYLHQLGIATDKITYLPNGVDYSRFSKPRIQDIQEVKNKLNIHNEPVVGFIGTLSLTSHPVDLLIEAFQKVHDQIPDAKLMIIGGGEDYNRLQSLVKIFSLSDVVVFTGRVPPEKINIYYRLANVIVDPIYDNLVAKTRLPLKLFESWVSQVPFISSDVGDRRRILGTPPAGLLVPPGEHQALADGIIRLLANPEFGQELVSLGSNRAKLYDWQILANSLAQVYQKVLEKH